MKQIESLDELVAQKFVYVLYGANIKKTHFGWFQNWSLQYAKILIRTKRIFRDSLRQIDKQEA